MMYLYRLLIESIKEVPVELVTLYFISIYCCIWDCLNIKNIKKINLNFIPKHHDGEYT